MKTLSFQMDVDEVSRALQHMRRDVSLYDTKLAGSRRFCFILGADPWFFGPVFS